jgi:predicted nucleotidyltransferase component of viral defense system
MIDGPKNVVASVLARLRNLAKEQGLSFNDVLQSYVIERFLARLAQSPQADSVLLKGALMLRVWGVPRARPTMDIDLLRRGAGDEASLRKLVEQCTAIVDPTDGVSFDASTIVAEGIRDETEYVGTRIRLQARLDNVRQTVQIDFGVGDAVYPKASLVEYPVLFGRTPVRLMAYPVEASIAEKFQAMVELDLRNSRMKDFYDIWILSRTLPFDLQTLSQAIRATFERRQTPIPTAPPAALTTAFFRDPNHQRQWVAFTRRIGEGDLGDRFAEVAAGIESFLMPVAMTAATGASDAASWSPAGPWVSSS